MAAPRKFALIIIATAVLAFTAAGCETVRQVTHPPSLHYLEDGDISASMWRLSGSIMHLDALVAAEVEPGPVTRESIIEELRAIEASARAISAEGQVTHHLMFDRHMDVFLEDVRRARISVQNDPPNYYLAGRLAGSCSACHVTVR